MHVKPEAMQSATESIARLRSWISSKSRPASGQLPTDSQSALKPATLETGQARIRTVGAITWALRAHLSEKRWDPMMPRREPHLPLPTRRVAELPTDPDSKTGSFCADSGASSRCGLFCFCTTSVDKSESSRAFFV